MGTNINQMNVIVGLLKVKVQTREMVSRHWILQVARDKSMFSTLAGKYGGYVTFRDNNKGKIIYIGTFIRQELSITQFITLQNCGVIQMHLFDINLLGDSSLKETDTFTTGGQPTILDIGLLNVKVQTREMVSRYWMLQTYDRSLETKSMFSTLAKKYDGYVIFGDNDKGNVISIGFKVLGIFIGDQIKRLSLAALKVFGRGLWLVFLIGHFKFGLCHFTVTSDKNDNLAHAQNSIEAFAKQGASLFRLPEIFHSRSQTPSQQKINLPLSTQLNAKIAEQNELREKELPLVLDNEKALTTKKDATRLAFFKDAQSTAMCSWDDCQKTMNE
ncbi:hypothetical protein RHMOL_Rhmol11G0083000 [Rhododendron molle]|uniref:Uncharacterized protein n=1 Tax=Rhododendron molle TaxID=49168 RepID=A0ACC0LPV6_RHOML|nr:hypothetical protein RHMOL_Rhmol11G0083000 [Rhododendron molle]